MLLAASPSRLHALRRAARRAGAGHRHLRHDRDFGSNDANEQDVANLVKSWNPDFIVTVGDNNYPDGEAATIDANVGKYYHEFIHPYTGTYGAGATTNRFWPVIGNRDWENQSGPKLQPYFDYFTLPNNERYYDFVQGPVHFFMLDSDSREPDGITASSSRRSGSATASPSRPRVEDRRPPSPAFLFAHVVA